MEVVRTLLSGDVQRIENIIESYGFCNIRSNSKSVMFAFDDESRGSCMLDINDLKFTRWSDETRGDILTVIMHKTGMNFKEALIDIRNKLGISDEKINIKKREDNCIFKELLDDLKGVHGNTIYTQYDVDKYKPIISTAFRRDGINIETQCEFDIRYCEESDRIVILWKDICGKVVGNTARANWQIPKNYDYKYLSLMPFNKREHIYGLYENREFILKSGYCVLFEAEKSTMQSHSFGFRACGSVGMSHIDKKQIQLLYDIGIRVVILAYDEDKHIIEYIKRANDIRSWFPDMQVYALYDENKTYLPSGSKNSPTDMGFEVFNKIFENCLKSI